MNNDLFYSRLPVNEIPLSDLLTEEHLFYKVPANWYVVITDIKNSTAAIQEGLHEAINLVATGSIVALLNIAFKPILLFHSFLVVMELHSLYRPHYWIQQRMHYFSTGKIQRIISTW